ncbi:MAG: PEP-CTERM sorting domain-containing protein [Phycisphaeraceae bacterium]|nr:PEP-CTERM sorting domain-containing protein [Phycisphaeraceae bacterium]
MYHRYAHNLQLQVLVTAVSLVLAFIVTPVWAQPTFSIDFQSPTSGLVSEGDVLTPVPPGMFPPPLTVIPAGVGGLGVLPNSAGVREVDALSYGTDAHLLPDIVPGQVYSNRWFFSVDEYAAGIPSGSAVTINGAYGLTEASADVYGSVTPNGVVFPFAGTNVGLRDGNGGLTPFPAPGNNLREPNPPTPFSMVDAADNLDALDIDAAPGKPVYFSLDSAYPDPLEAPGINYGTAIANGFVGGDVLVTTAGGPPVLYAAAALLGLDQLVPGTIDHDDLDALVVWENGNGVYDAVIGPYSWLSGQTDMLLYSVRRGSSIIGTPDALQGLAISEGDILVPVLQTSGVFAPGIFVPAEALGLATIRTHGPYVSFGYNDDLDALDVQQFAVPEPASVTLLGIGIMLLARGRRSQSRTI